MKYFPIEVQKSIFDINFTRLYAKGKKIILCDLDNTLIPYSESMPSKELIEWAEKVKTIGFKLYLFSNNKDTRVLPFSLVLGADGLWRSSKRLSAGQTIPEKLMQPWLKWVSAINS